MPLKLNISDKGKAYKLEVEEEALAGRAVGDKFDGKDIKSDLDGYELEITGGSDKSGFPLSKDVEGIGLKRVLLTKGFAMKNNQKGLRLKKSVRGKMISSSTSQVNIKVLKEGGKKLDEVFGEGEEGKAEEGVVGGVEGEKKEEVKREEKPVEEKKEEVKEDKEENVNEKKESDGGE